MNAQTIMLSQSFPTVLGPSSSLIEPGSGGNGPHGKLEDTTELREAFDTFVGETFYGTLLKSLRKSTDKPAYFHGGRAEEVFQGQLDQTLVQELAKVNADQLTGPMFDLFNLSRS